MTRLPLSPNVAGLGGSPTLAIADRVRVARAAGRHVIDLGIGEPSFRTPAFVADAAHRAIESGQTRYTAVEGIAPLREAIAADAAGVAGRHITSAQIVVACGSKQTLFESCFVLFGPSDEVLIPTPAWPSYAEMVRLARATAVDVRGDPSRAWKVDVGMLAAKASPKTRGLILSSPVNPTGAVYDADELRAIAALASERGWWIIADEIYRPLSYDAPAASILEVCDHDASVVVVGGVAKAFSMTGWRIGWAIAPAAVARAMIAVQSHLTSNATTVAQHAALEALTNRDAARDAQRAMVSALRDRRDVAHGLLCAANVPIAPPAGAFYYFLPVGDYAPGASARLAAALLDEQDVAVVPGEAFGVEGWIRASFAGEDEEVRTGFSRLAAFLRHRNA